MDEEFKFKDGAKAEIGTEDPFYALTLGGYLKPASVLENAEKAKKVENAAALVQRFIQACQDANVIEES